MNTARWLPVALALAFAAAPAQAGPIGWGYTSKFTTIDGPSGTWVMNGAGNAGTEAAAELSNRPAGSAQGSSVVTVGEVAPGRTYSPDDRYLTHPARSFTFRLELQDEKSGQRGTVGFDGGASELSHTVFNPFRQLTDRKEYVNNSTGSTTWLASATTTTPSS